MNRPAQALLRDALQLPPNDRAALIDELVVSLDKPDPALDAAWLKEAEARMAAWRAGQLDAIDADEVFADLGRQD